MTELPRGMARLPALPIVLLFLIFTGLAFAYAINLGTPSSPIDPNLPRATPSPSVSLPLSLEDGLPLATARAEQWREDARLILISAQFDWLDGTPAALGGPRGGNLIYTFAATETNWLGQDRYPVLTVMIGRESGQIFFEAEEQIDVPPGATQTLSGLTFDSVEAFELAQQLAGLNYRAPCPNVRNQVQVIFDTAGNRRPSWAVVYYDSRDVSHNDIIVRIDAMSGVPTIKPGTPVPCAPV